MSPITWLRMLSLMLPAALLPWTARAQAPTDRAFSLFGAAASVLQVNRVSCGMKNVGQICTSTSSTRGGGFWPEDATTGQQYIFASGPFVASIIGPDGGTWAGDTAGGRFFDLAARVDATALTAIHDAGNPDDAASWPDVARVPPGYVRSEAAGRISLGAGDQWWLAWEGEPATSTLLNRAHPLGVLAEFRMVGWPYPLGNDDVIYAMMTFYNITSLDPADYAGRRPEIRDTLVAAAQRFHQLNNAASGITLPQGGYTMTRLYSGWMVDPDVGSAGNNFGSVQAPLFLAYGWEYAFSAWSGTFDPAVFGAPFFAGVGLVGTLPLGNYPPAIFTGFGSGGFSTARSIDQLWRISSGNINTALGDNACNFDPVGTHICYIRGSAPFDMRYLQSVGPYTIAPGESVTIPVAYVFAAPLAQGGCPGPACNIPPGSPTIIGGMSDPAVVAGGVNPIDSIAGFLGAQDVSGDGVLQADEFITEPRSLYWKAQVARALFDHQFLLPQAPAAPDFFLIPERDAVTVVWRPSISEQTGDPYYDLASGARIANAQGALVPNVLYDPNYRQFDVEGYRIYRGRVDDPAALELVAQFDYSGTVMSDYGGYVNPTQFCAPELGVTPSCPAAFDSPVPGVPRSVHVDVDISSQFVQTRPGDRTTLPNGLVTVLHADTVSGPNGYLDDTGVPFVWRDSTVREGFRYFYTVTAFDVNSLQSGPASQESRRVLKAARPASRAVNRVAGGQVTARRLLGRGTVLEEAPSFTGAAPLPVIEPNTGRFAGPFPPATGWDVTFESFVSVLLDSGSVRLSLDSVQLGSPYAGIPHRYWWTARSGTAVTRMSLPVLQRQEVGLEFARTSVSAVPVGGSLANRYGGDADYRLPVEVTQVLTGADYAGLYGRGCVNGRSGFGFSRECAYNGSRWFDGPSPAKNETKVHPIEGNQANFVGTPVTNYNNAGELSGVVTIHNTQAYQSVGGSEYRPVEGIKAGAHRAADFNVFWGTGGQVDSVIDITHNVPVPFSPDMGLSWGILNGPAASLPGSYDQRLELTATDMGCVEPLRSYATAISCGTGGPRYQLARVAVPSSIAFFSPALADARTAPVAVNAGIVFYLAGDFFTMELAGGQVPAKGTVWSLRQYIGAITGGSGDGGNYGPYAYANPEGILPLTAAGAELELTWSGANALRAPVTSDLAAVHPVPDPYMFGNAWTNDQAVPVIRFVNLPADAIIRIYTASGVLVRLLEHHSTSFGGSEDWDVRNRSGRKVASGVYFFHVESGNARRTGRMTIVNPDRGR